MQAFIRVNFHHENAVSEYEIQPSEARIIRVRAKLNFNPRVQNEIHQSVKN
jgi:predicted TIM-barrel enzyme